MNHVEDDVVQEAGEDDFLLHARLEGPRGALQHVIRRGEAQLEEVEQRRLLRHRLDLAELAVAPWHEQIARAPPAGPRQVLSAGFELGHRGERGLLGGLLRRLRGSQLILEEMLEGIGLLIRGHQGHGGGAAHAGKEGPAIDVHDAPPLVGVLGAPWRGSIPDRHDMAWSRRSGHSSIGERARASRARSRGPGRSHA
jgi:hypothetical protein